MIDKNRNRIDVFFQVSYIPFDESIAYLCVIRNITDRKKAEMILRENEEKYRLLVETSNDLIVKTDKVGKIQFFNKAAMNTLGYSQEELFKKNYMDLIHPDDLQLVNTKLQQLSEHKKIIKVLDYRLLRKNGKIFHVNTSLAPIIDKLDDIVGFLGSSRDISDRKITEEELNTKTKELERSNNELQQFVYVASHDLKAPLKTISGYIHLLKKNNKDLFNKKSIKHIGSAINGLNRMERFIDDLLKYSQVSNTPKQNFKLIDLNKILDVTLSILKASIEENGADIKIIGIDNYPHILGDFTQIAQLFQNLILNSMKFVKDKSPEIRIGREEKNGFHLFFVRDNGIGLEFKSLDKIFAIFQRLHSSSEYSGNGIGLAVCKKIVERHGGEIWVESEIGKGSTFWFSIPKVNKK